MKSNESKDGAERRERAVAEGNELRERAVEHASQVHESLHLREAPVSADSPPAVPAPPVAAHPYPRRQLKATMPATPRAIATHLADPPPPLSAEADPVVETPGAVEPAAAVPAVLPVSTDPDPDQ